MIDRARAEAAFRAYTARYDANNAMIRLKIEHTLRVTDNCDAIARSLDMDAGDVDLAWLLGLLHDIGRFEQVRRFGTFLDAVSVDHAALGAELLFEDNLIADYPVEGLSEADLRLLETAIRLHNRLSLPDDLEARTRRFCELIRDADKVDIFRVIAEQPAAVPPGQASDTSGACEAVMACVYAHRCVPRDIRKTRFEGRVSHVCMAFELSFAESRRRVRQQGYLIRLLEGCGESGRPVWSEREREQLGVIRAEIEAAWGEPLSQN